MGGVSQGHYACLSGTSENHSGQRDSIMPNGLVRENPGSRAPGKVFRPERHMSPGMMIFGKFPLPAVASQRICLVYCSQKVFCAVSQAMIHQSCSVQASQDGP